MTKEGAPGAARAVVLDALHEVAPNVDIAAVGSDDPFMEAFDFDSVDFLSFVEGLHERTGVVIPERDYARLLTVDACVEYLTAHRESGVR